VTRCDGIVTERANLSLNHSTDLE